MNRSICADAQVSIIKLGIINLSKLLVKGLAKT